MWPFSWDASRDGSVDPGPLGAEPPQILGLALPLDPDRSSPCLEFQQHQKLPPTGDEVVLHPRKGEFTCPDRCRSFWTQPFWTRPVQASVFPSSSPSRPTFWAPSTSRCRRRGSSCRAKASGWRRPATRTPRPTPAPRSAARPGTTGGGGAWGRGFQGWGRGFQGHGVMG